MKRSVSRFVPAAIVEGEVIDEQAIARQAAAELRQLSSQEHEIRATALEQLIDRKLLDLAARRRALTPEQLLQQVVDAAVAEPGDAEVEAFYLARQDRLNRPFAEVKTQLADFLRRARIEQARRAFVGALRQKAKVTVLLRPHRAG